MNDTVNLGELAQVVGRSEVTLRKLMARHDDFPIAARGSNGVAYSFDARAVREWLDAHGASEAEAAEERRAELAQLQLELTGGLAYDDKVLTAKERKDALEVAIAEAKWARLRGELVAVDEVERAAEDAFDALRSEIMKLPDLVGRMVDLDRESRARIDQACRAALGAAATRVAELGRRADAETT